MRASVATLRFVLFACSTAATGATKNFGKNSGSFSRSRVTNLG
jgi:hypothetical protein